MSDDVLTFGREDAERHVNEIIRRNECLRPGSQSERPNRSACT